MADDPLTRHPVLLTGGAGFIGAWLAEGLADLGAEVILLVRDKNPRARLWTDGVADRCQIVQGDIRDQDLVQRTISERAVGSVFHLAAQPIVIVAQRSPLSTFESNVAGTCAILEACRLAREAGAPLDRVVCASSDHAYGTHEEMPYREDYALQPDFPYDVSKGCTDLIVRTYGETYQLPVAVTRMANTYGGGDRHWSRIVPDTARALVEGRRPVIRSDGTPERDFIYVTDAVEAYLAVARALDDPAHFGSAWNAGHTVPVPILEIVETMIEVTGADVEPEIQGTSKPFGEIDREFVDSTKIREQLGWRPEWELRDGLAKTMEWYERTLTDERKGAW